MDQVTDLELKKRLAFDNPWWAEGTVPARFREWPKRDYLTGFLALLEAKVRRAVVLLGPRRVGKTVLLHQAAQQLIDNGIEPKSILYVSVDTPVYSGTPLDKLLSLFQEIHGHQRDAKLFVLYDEIQYHPQWEVHLKSLVDSFPAIRFVASGSAAAALRMKSNESGAGRFTDFLLPPLTFAEFLDFAKRPLPDRSGAPLSASDVTRLNQDFLDYLNFGGFPEAVIDEQVRRNMDRYIANDIIDKVLLRDLPSLYGVSDTQELNRLFTVLAYNTGNEVSLDELSKSSGVAKNTLKKYLEYLEAAFLIHRLNRVDQNAKRFRRATHFKVYLTNPSIRAALFGAVGPEDAAMGRMAETAFIGQLVHTNIVEDSYYARWDKGEVDLIEIDKQTQRAVHATEIKWSDSVIKNINAECGNIIKFCRGNRLDSCFLLTRTVSGKFDLSGVKIFAHPVALAALDVAMLVLDTIDLGLHPRPLFPPHWYAAEDPTP
jgi:predicted AAA+ superfamily ATPase